MFLHALSLSQCDDADIFSKMACDAACGIGSDAVPETPVQLAHTSTLFGPLEADKGHAVSFWTQMHNLTQRCTSCAVDSAWAPSAGRMVGSCCTTPACVRNVSDHCSIMHASLGTLSLSEMSDMLAAMPESACWDAPHTLGAWAAENT